MTTEKTSAYDFMDKDKIPELVPGRLVRLEAENVMKLNAVEIALPEDDPITIVGGNNGQGKSSLLHCIAIALGGSAEMPAEPIQIGKDEAKVVLTFEGITVKVKLVRGKEGKINRYLVIESSDGAKYPSPQALLDALTGKLAFDPEEFGRLEGKKQLAAVQKYLGLDFTKLDADRLRFYNDRTMLNRDLAQAKSKLAGMPAIFTDVPAAEVTSGDIVHEINAAVNWNNTIGQLKQQALTLEGRHASARSEIASIESQIAQLQAARAAKVEALNTIANDLTAAKKRADEAQPKDVTALQSQLSEIENTNRKIRSNAERLAIGSAVAAQIKKVVDLEAQLADLDKSKADQIAAAEFPMEGISFGESGLLVEGVPFEQCNDAMRIAVSTAMGMALNPKLKLMLIKRGSLLDDNMLGIVRDLARQGGFQILLEKVGKGKDVRIVIEEGNAIDNPQFIS